MIRDYDTSKKLIIVGCGGHSKVVTDVAETLGFKNIDYLNTYDDVKTFYGKNVIKKELEKFQYYFFVAIGDNSSRQRVFKNFISKNPQAIAISLIHPSSIVTSRCTIGVGTLIMPLCVINSSTNIGDGVIINTRSNVDHDSSLMDFSSLAPGVSMGGNVFIGERTAISVGASVKHGVKIGKDTVVGGSSYVSKDVGDNMVVYGVPAKFIRNRRADEKYL